MDEASSGLDPRPPRIFRARGNLRESEGVTILLTPYPAGSRPLAPLVLLLRQIVAGGFRELRSSIGGHVVLNPDPYAGRPGSATIPSEKFAGDLEVRWKSISTAYPARKWWSVSRRDFVACTSRR